MEKFLTWKFLYFVYFCVFLWAGVVRAKTGNLNEEYTDTLTHDQSVVYTFELENDTVDEYVIRLHVSNIEPLKDYPLLVVVKQQQDVVSFQVPLTVDSLQISNNVSKTLCPIKAVKDGKTVFRVEFSSSVPIQSSLKFKFMAQWLQHFDLQLNVPINLTVYPAQPMYFRYRFPVNMDSVAVRLVSTDDVCMVLSVQDLKCPVSDSSDDIQTSGLYQTITNLGVISTNAIYFPTGFYVVIALKKTDFVCNGIEKLFPVLTRRAVPSFLNLRSKNVTLSVHSTPNRRYYLFPIFGAISFFLMFYVATIVILVTYNAWQRRNRGRPGQICLIESTEPIDLPDAEVNKSQNQQPGPSASQPIPHVDNGSSMPSYSGRNSFHTISGCFSRERHGWFSSSDDEDVESKSIHHHQSGTLVVQTSPHASTNRRRRSTVVVAPGDSRPHSDENLAASTHAVQSVTLSGTTSLRQPSVILCVTDLSKKRYTTLNRKYLLYFWYLIIISIFYGLPAFQLILIYQKMLVETGNEDMCFYNFECARPLGIFTAFNSIISNIGYIMLGLLFLLLTARRDILSRRVQNSRNTINENFGLPHHYGLYYAMGLALTMEGVMSACYHMCPSFNNFQFDTAYMYVLAMLIMLKIYQTRHPDVNASAHSAYMVMAVVILLGVTGVFYGGQTFWIVFTVFFMIMSVLLTMEIYYMGQWNIDFCLPRRLYTLIRTDGIYCFRPLYLQRMILLLIANIVNFALAGYGVVTRPRDFSSFLLSIFMINVVIYTLYYILMKLRNRERLLPLPLIYLLFVCITWSGATFFFFQHATSWQFTPAKSRAINKPCLLFDFYDAHDVWHFLSATSLFFFFMMLMYLDDDLADKPRDRIAVF